MPYIVIYVDTQYDVDEIVFNDEHGNTQYIGATGDWSVGFDVIEVLADYTEKMSCEHCGSTDIDAECTKVKKN